MRGTRAIRRAHGRNPVRRAVAALVTATVVVGGAGSPASAAEDVPDLTGRVVLPEGVTLPPDDTITVDVRSGPYNLASVDLHPADLTFGFDGIWEDPVQLRVTESAGVVADGWYTGSGTSWNREAAADVVLRSDVTVRLGEAVAIEGAVELPDGLAAARVDARVAALVWQDDQVVAVQGADATVEGDRLTYRVGGLHAGETYRLSFGDASYGLRSGYAGGVDGSLVGGWDEAAPVTAPATVDLVPGAEPRIAGSLQLPPGVDAEDTELRIRAHRVGSEQMTGDVPAPDPLAPGSLAFAIPGLDPNATYTLSVFDERSRIAAAYLGPDGWQAGAEGAQPLSPSTAWLSLDTVAAASFTGPVVLPAGHVGGQFPPSISSYADGELMKTGYLAADGTYAVPGLLPGGRYDLTLSDPSHDLRDGHIAADGSVVPGDAPAALLAPQELTIRPTLSGRAAVHVTFPDGGDSYVSLHAFSPGEDSKWNRDAGIDGAGTVYVRGLEEGKSYLLQITGNGLIADGLYEGDGVSPGGGGKAVPVHAGDEISLALRPFFSVVPLLGVSQGYCTGALPTTWVQLHKLLNDGRTWSFQLGLSADGFSAPRFGRLRPGSTYALTIRSSDPGVPTGWVRADGSVSASADEALRFTADASIVVPFPVDPSSVLGAITPPTVSGTPRVGSTLTASAATWTRPGTRTVVTWYRDGVLIAGASGTTYTLTAADMGTRVTARATATTSTCRAASISSTPTATITPGVLSNTTKPSVVGTAKVGAMLTANPGTWSVTGVSSTYQWLRNGLPLAGATGATYTPTPADRGATIAVRVTASRAGYTSATATSAATSTVGDGTITNRTAPSIVGTARVGERLSARIGTWSVSGVVYRLQWLRNSVPVAGATAATYLQTPADRGAAISVRVTVSHTGYAPTTATSKATAPVAAGLITNVTPPGVAGTAKVGQRLTATVGTWTPGGLSYRYKWYRSGVLIAGATTSTYTPVAVDVGRTIVARVTAVRAGYTSVAVSSTATAAVRT